MPAVAMDKDHNPIVAGAKMAKHPVDGGSKFFATAYGPPWNAMNGTGVTKNGTDLKTPGDHYVVAAGPMSGLKMGDHITISPNPYGNDFIVFEVADTGGAIAGKHIDIFVPTRDRQLSWGRRRVTVNTTKQDVGKPDSIGETVHKVTGKLDPLEAFRQLAGLVSVMFTRNFWIRVGLIIGGLFLLGFGVVQMGKQYAIGQVVGSVVKKATPTGTT